MSEVDATLRRIKKAREFAEKKIKNATTQEEREDAEDLKDYIERLVDQMCKYTETVFRDSKKNFTRSQLMKNMDRKDYQTYCEEIERARKVNHDALITQVRMTDDMCEYMGIDPIYGKLPEKYKKDSTLLMGAENRGKDGVVETRHAIADWAWSVTIGSTVALYIDVSELDYNQNKEDMEKIAETYHQKFGGKNQAKDMIKQMTEPEVER